MRGIESPFIPGRKSLRVLMHTSLPRCVLCCTRAPSFHSVRAEDGSARRRLTLGVEMRRSMRAAALPPATIPSLHRQHRLAHGARREREAPFALRVAVAALGVGVGRIGRCPCCRLQDKAVQHIDARVPPKDPAGVATAHSSADGTASGRADCLACSVDV